MEVIYSFITGLIVGGIFTLLKFPIPAPPTLSGIAGIVGIFVGYLLIKLIK